MKTADHIEASEEAPEVFVGVDNTDEMKRHFGVYADEQPD